ncbi:hypothetical protein Patl_1738 [Paraglaciecola sp. T6c]|nr:hypothetical protein Patl_1738 [Paraglaciecola sp. T6c]
MNWCFLTPNSPGIVLAPYSSSIVNELKGIGPHLLNQWQGNHAITSASPKVTWKDKTLSGLATMALVKRQIRRVGEGKNPKGKLSPVISLILDQIRGQANEALSQTF